MTHSYVWRSYLQHDSFICVTWLVHIYDMACLVHMCDITHGCAWHDIWQGWWKWTHMHESWHTDEWVMPHMWMIQGIHMNQSWHTYEESHGTHVQESWHIHAWVMAHIWKSYGTYTNKSWHTYARVMAHICMSHGTHMHESWHTYVWVMAHICISHGANRIDHVT